MELSTFPQGNATLPASQWYRSHGLIPVPIPRRKGWKSPILKDWQKLRPEPSEMAVLFPPDVALNIGLLLGNPSGGLVDVDLDAPEAVEVGGLLLPQTGWISGRSGKPRSHWWYRLDTPPAKSSEKYTDVDAEKTCLVELRSTGGQTVVPPSVHLSGEQIVWESDGTPTNMDFHVLRRSVAMVAGVALLARHWPREGCRQDAFLAFAGALSHGGMSQAEAERICSALVRVTRDDEGSKRLGALQGTYEKAPGGTPITGWPTLSKLLTGDGFRTTAAILGMWRGIVFENGDGSLYHERPMIFLDKTISGNFGNSGDAIGSVAGVKGSEGGARKAGELEKRPVETRNKHVEEPWPELLNIDSTSYGDPFPLGVLPKRLAEYVRQISWTMNSPTDFAGTSVITLASGVIGNAAKLQISPNHHQPALLYSALVGVPGSMKSPMIDHFTKALTDRQKRYNDLFETAMAEWKIQQAESEEELPKPVLRIAIGRETTTESLLFMLTTNPRGFPLVHDELSGLFSGLNQYKRGGGNDRQVYLSIWSQATIDQKRKTELKEGNPPMFVYRPSVSILGGIQPDMLGSFKLQGPRGQTFDDGGMDRFLFCWPELLPEIEEQYRAMDPSLEDSWSGIVKKLSDDIHEEVLVRMSADDRSELTAWTRRHADEVNDVTFPGELYGPWRKMRACATRLALVLHLLDWACGELVSLDTLTGSAMRRGGELADYYKSHRRKVAGASSPDDKLEGVRRVADWVVRNKASRFQKRSIYHALRGTWKTIEALEPILDSARKYHVIRPEESESRSGPGRKPSPWFEAHPDLIRDTDAENGSHNSRNAFLESPEERKCSQVERPESRDNIGKSASETLLVGYAEPTENGLNSTDPRLSPDWISNPRNPGVDAPEVLADVEEHPIPEDLDDALRKLEMTAASRTNNPKYLDAIRNQIDECRADARRGRSDRAWVFVKQLQKTIPECLAAWGVEADPMP